MPKFNLSCRVTVSAYTIVEAAKLEEAIEVAKDRFVIIDGENSGEYNWEFWIIDDGDGIPEDIKAQDAAPHSHQQTPDPPQPE